MGSEVTYFKKGNPGKPKGALTVISKTVRDIVLETFLDLQNDPKNNFRAFCIKYPVVGMQICAKLIPNEVKAQVDFPQPISIIFNKDANSLPVGTDPESNFSLRGESGGVPAEKT